MWHIMKPKLPMLREWYVVWRLPCTGIVHKNHHYLNVLQYLVIDYNHRLHRSWLKRAPVNITKSNEAIVWQNQYIDPLQKSNAISKKKIFKYKVEAQIRISHLIYTFQRDYQEKWTEEIYTISRRYNRDGVPIYQLKDMTDDSIEGNFYGNELQRVYKEENYLWHVEKVLKRRKRGNQKEVYVK